MEEKDYIPRKRKSNFDVLPPEVKIENTSAQSSGDEIKIMPNLALERQCFSMPWSPVTEEVYIKRIENALLRNFDFVVKYVT